MSLLMKGGISNLSELTIDAAPDKAKAIADLILTTRGDLLYRNTLAERLEAQYGVGMNFLHMTNSGQFAPVWKDIQTDIIYITGAVNRIIYPPILSIPVPVLSLVAAEGHSGGGHPVTPPSLSVPIPSISIPATSLYPGLAVDGFVAHDETPTETDQTAEANEATANDMVLMHAVLVGNGDGCFIGLASPWDWVTFKLGTAGVGTYIITWKYWTSGAAWANLTIIEDQTLKFKTTGFKLLRFSRPVDWAVKTIAGIADLYWIYAWATEGTMTVQPKGTQVWIGQY